MINSFIRAFGHSGHIQVSQVPDRGEPSSSGEINYQYIFQLLQDLGYNQWIGCEYNPQGIVSSFSFSLY
jgi:hydroxypyruvate isomerase